MVDNSIGYRQYLRRALAERSTKNPRYSLRAFSRKTGLSPSHVSRVLNGIAGLSLPAAYKIAVELELDPVETKAFINKVNYENASEDVKGVLREGVRKSESESIRRIIDLEVFTVISDWHHLPIYELIKSRNDKMTAAVISKQFGLSLAETRAALDRLERLGLIAANSKGFFRATENKGIHTTDDIASAAIRKHHQQMSNKAVEALSQPVEQREFQSLQLAFDRKRLRSAQKRIREFIESFEREFKADGSPDIYQFNLQLFALTKGDSK